MRFPFKTSLRSVLTAQAGLVIFLAVFICAFSLLWFSIEEDREDLDASLVRQAQVIGKILESHPKNEGLSSLKLLLASEGGRRMAEIRRANGTIYHLPKPQDGPLLISTNQILSSEPVFETRIIGGRSMRIVLEKEGENLIAVASAPESLRETLQNVFKLYVILTVVLLVIVLTGGRWLANRALAPIAEMARAASRVTSLEAPQSLPVNQPDRELHSLAVVLNDMLARLQTSFYLVQRFTADAAHEIKTPLAIMHGHLESTLQSSQLPDKSETALLLTLREVERLNSLVEGLLLLSRSDAGRLSIDRKPIDLTEMTAEIVHDAEILCAPLNLTITTEIASGVTIPGDRELLRQVLLNLLDNACKYNRPEGRIHIALHDNPPRFEIGNNGDPIPENVVPHLFERFQRGDTSRTRETTSPAGRRGDGLGLGLSISREIIRAHGGRIELQSTGNDWTVFRVTLFESEQ